MSVTHDAAIVTARRGTTLVELVVALALLGTALAGIGASSALALRQLALATARTRGATMIQARLDSLAGLRCAALARASSGTGEAGGVAERWTLVRAGSRWLVIDTVHLPRARTELSSRASVRCR